MSAIGARWRISDISGHEQESVGQKFRMDIFHNISATEMLNIVNYKIWQKFWKQWHSLYYLYFDDLVQNCSMPPVRFQRSRE